MSIKDIKKITAPFKEQHKSELENLRSEKL